MSAEKQPFVVMAKPVGSLCNMKCDYCYYLDTEYESGLSAYRMNDDTLETFIRTYMEASPGPVVSFTWHGGEPAAAGLPFFQRVLELQQAYLPEGFTCTNNLQTNGTLLDDAFCEFLAENRFDVGLSIDGTRRIHNRYRHMADGSDSYDQVYAAVSRLLTHGIRPDLLCTVTSDTAVRGREVYQTLRSFQTGWIQFIPIIRPLPDSVTPDSVTPDSVTPDSVTPQGYGDFLRDVFAEWFFHDLGAVNVQLFAETAAELAGGTASLCTLAETCGNVLVVEHDGGVYACDHFVDGDHRLGKVGQDAFQDMLCSEAQQHFGQSKRTALTKECRSCPYLTLCHGSCPKDRFSRSSDGEPGHPYLCAGLKAFYEDAVPLLRYAIQESQLHVSSKVIMQKAAARQKVAYASFGRNDPCPCGCGRKFKACIGKRLPSS